MHRQVGATHVFEFRFDLFLGWVDDDRRSLTEDELLDLDKTKQPAMVHFAGIDLVDLTLAHENYLVEKFVGHRCLAMAGGHAPEKGRVVYPKAAAAARNRPFPADYVNYSTAYHLDPLQYSVIVRNSVLSIAMALKLKIVSEHREIVGDAAVREFGDDGGTIGRSLDNDWILPDPDRYISGCHASVDCRGGMYYLADLSSNGVYINDDDEPLGKGNPRRLFNGDRLRLGDFEILVSIEEGESIVVPLEEEQVVSSDPLEDSVEEVSLRTGVQLLDEDEIIGDAGFESVLFDDETDVEGSDATYEEMVEPEPVKSTSSAREAAGVDISTDDLFDTFLDGLGISRSDLHPSVDPADAMRNAGEAMREFVGGMGKLLISRANLKTAFKLDLTTILPEDNNPLKLSESTTDSIMQLLVAREGEYLGPRDAVRQVCSDLLFHQDAFLEAMSNAFVEFAERFSPDEITAAFEHNDGSKPMLGFLSKRKYWQFYCDLYPVMTERGGAQFPQMFAEDFVKSYERQVNEFKRLDPSVVPTLAQPLEPLAEDDFESRIDKALDIDSEDFDEDTAAGPVED